MRWVLLSLLIVVGCKKKEEPAPEEPMTGPPPAGHSVTKVKEDGSSAEAGSAKPEGTGTGTTATPSGGSETAATGTVDAGGTADAARWGGNGKPAYRDEAGHPHGPGGPIFMGRGADCTDALDHCLRDGVWFAVPNIRPGSIYRATPAYELENKWWNFREEEVDCQELFKTKVAKASDLVAGEPVIWLVEENQEFVWLKSESDALTSSRWEAGIIESGTASDKFRVKGWQWAVLVPSARVIVERKKCPGAS